MYLLYHFAVFALASVLVTWLIHMWNMTHSHVCNDPFVCVTRTIHMRDTTYSYAWNGSFIGVTWLLHMCDMTHAYAWHDAFIRVNWLIHTCDMTHSYAWHDSLHGWHDWFIRVTYLAFLYHTHPRVEWRGLTAFARRNKACVFRKLINLRHSVISPKYFGTQIISKIPTQID